MAEAVPDFHRIDQRIVSQLQSYHIAVADKVEHHQAPVDHSAELHTLITIFARAWSTSMYLIASGVLSSG